jgi:hypothetical protein
MNEAPRSLDAVAVLDLPALLAGGGQLARRRLLMVEQGGD